MINKTKKEIRYLRKLRSFFCQIERRKRINKVIGNAKPFMYIYKQTFKKRI
jgi:hypothetical protein